MARPTKPHHQSWDNKAVPGLSRCSDGRWRVRIAGKDIKFTATERGAIDQLWRLQQEHAAPTVSIPMIHVEPDDFSYIPPGGWVPPATDIDQRAFWAYVAKVLTEEPEHAAKMTGIPALARLRAMDLPQAGIRIEAIRQAYLKHSPASDKAKREALAPFNRLVEFADARTLDDLSEPTLARWRDHVVNHSGLTSSGTIGVYFTRVRNVLRLAARGEMDGKQIDAAISRCKSKLYPPANNVHDDPQPISRENFQRLLAGAEQTDVPAVWRAMLLIALNAALYMEDVCDLQWSNLDLEAGTLVDRRKKTGKCIRVATLWPETLAALGLIPRRGGSPYVFTSPHGTRYNKNTKINDFKGFREKVSVAGVTWSHLRDGAYTAAAQAPGVDEKFARLLAGHKAAGLQDKYVVRNPQIVRPACDAVYAAYGPFAEVAS